MIYFFYGADSDARRKAVENILNRLALEKENDFNLFQMSDLDFDLEKIKELATARDLFRKLLVVVLDGLPAGRQGALTRAEAESALAEHLPSLAESENIFIISERRPGAEFVKAAKKLARQAGEFALSQTRHQPFSNFLVSDAFGRRDRKGAWLSLARAVATGASGEEIVGILFWQIKNMLLVKKASPAVLGGAEKLNLKPFVFQKARDFAERFSEGELAVAAGRLVDLVHLGRRRGEDLLAGLELFLLKTL